MCSEIGTDSAQSSNDERHMRTEDPAINVTLVDSDQCDASQER